MVQIHAKPFLEYLIEQLRDQGFQRILLLLGYLPEIIQEYFRDGSRWGLKVQYSVSGIEDETGRRLKLAASHLDPYFLLLYCDNYWPMQIEKMWTRFVAAQVPAMITVYSNNDGYTRNSVRVDQHGYVIDYDKSCKSPGLQGVEISYGLLSKSVLSMLPDKNVSLEETLYPRLARHRELLAYVTDHRYYSVGALHRLSLTEAFFASRPAVILDRDGVLNKRPPQAHYVQSWEKFEWLPGAREALRLYSQAGYRVVVVSNQAGIGRGVMKETDLQHIHQRMQADVKEAGGQIEAFYYCPHDWSDGCDCRKPKPGLLYQAQRELSLDLTRTLFIGDDERDRQAADAAGCPSAMVSDEVSLLDIVRKVVSHG
jgi:D-glycero-D-manno-heptose 1,7-bisphosphate phosphatase